MGTAHEANGHDRPPSANAHRIGTAAGVAGLVALSLYLTYPVISCPETCFLDYVAMHGGEVGNFELPDARLNAWILGWVQHAAWNSPGSLFDANAFFPARNTLAGSEHMIGNALITSWVPLFSDSAIALHQIALALSFALLALNVFAFVRWAGGSSWAAFLAGAAAMYMPWRYSEVSHLQLLSAQWIPLAWWLTTRILMGEWSRRLAVALLCALTIQMLTSFYLAYFVLFSGLCLTLGIALQTHPPIRTWIRLGVLYATPSLLLVALAIPYLSRYSAYQFAGPEVIPESTPPLTALAFLAPSLTLFADHERMVEVSYYIPLVVFALALIPFANRLRRTDATTWPDSSEHRIRVASLGVFAAIVGAFVLMLGRQLAVGDADLPILGTLFAKFVPGFSQMRAEFRWGIVIGIAFPLLAGMGIALLHRWFVRNRPLEIGLNIGVAALLAVNTPLFELPVKPAWRESTGIRAAHRALADLPAGTTVELPWGFKEIHLASYGSRYMLASSIHWNPLLNGYTAYLPPVHFFLQRLAQGLPDAEAIDRLRRLTDLRWIIVHPDKTPPQHLSRWDRATERGIIEPVFTQPSARVYRVPERADGGSLIESLRSADRPLTFNGLARDPLDVARAVGQLRVQSPTLMRYQYGTGLKSWLQVDVRNLSTQNWPGFDFWTEGLVELRYRFIDSTGAVVHEQTGALDADVLAGQTIATQVIGFSPAIEGSFTVRFDLVQRIGAQLHPLAVAAVDQTVEVEPASARSSRIRDALHKRSKDPTRVESD